MTRVILLTTILLASSAIAENKTWTGKAHNYKGQPAELLVALDGYNDLETAIKVGTINNNGRFQFELPQEIPDTSLITPEVREDCGEITPGLKLGVISSLLIKDNVGIIGEIMHANRSINFADITPENANNIRNTKITAWFYANQNGIIKEDCQDETSRQISNVSFQKGWNVLTAYYQTQNDIITVQIRNGYTEGLQRWYFSPQKPEQP
jgi:hypothetical protein